MVNFEEVKATTVQNESFLQCKARMLPQHYETVLSMLTGLNFTNMVLAKHQSSFVCVGV